MAKIGIFSGSVYGGATGVAEFCAEKLEGAGHQVACFAEPVYDDLTGNEFDLLLFVSSTTGQGDLPDNIAPMIFTMKDRFPLQNGRPYAVIGLGDSSYGDTYCNAGKQIDELLQELQGNALIERLDIDACEHLDPIDAVEPWFEGFLNKVSALA